MHLSSKDLRLIVEALNQLDLEYGSPTRWNWPVGSGPNSTPDGPRWTGDRPALRRRP